MAQHSTIGTFRKKYLNFPKFFSELYIYMEQPEVDDGIVAIVYNREKKRITDEHDKLFNNLKEIYGSGFDELFDESLEDFITKHLTKSLTILKKKHYPKLEESPAASSHAWIGINPPHGITIVELYQLTEQLVNKYKWASCHAYCVEAHTDNGYRPHIHMMVRTKEKPYRLISHISKHFSVAPNFIECKTFHKGVLFGEHYDYITGHKTDHKNSNVKADQEERETLGIPQFVQNIF